MTARTQQGGDARHDLLRRACAAFNAQDADGLLALVSDDVDWPDGTGARLHGRARLHDYWTQQWTRTRTRDEVTGVDDFDDGRIAVRLRQVVRALDGSTVSTGTFVYVFGFEGGLIQRLDIEQPLAGLSAG